MSETEQAVIEKAEDIKATEEKSVSSVVESEPKHETVHEVIFDRTAAVLQDAHKDQMMEEYEASTNTANETMKEADITTEMASARIRLGWRRPAHRSQHRHTSRDKIATDDDGMSNTVSASVPLERGHPMTNQAETQKTGTVAVRRQEQVGVSSSEEHKTFRLARARERAEKDFQPTTSSTRHADQSIGIRVSASRSATDHEAHSQA